MAITRGHFRKPLCEQAIRCGAFGWLVVERQRAASPTFPGTRCRSPPATMLQTASHADVTFWESPSHEASLPAVDHTSGPRIACGACRTVRTADERNACNRGPTREEYE